MQQAPQIGNVSYQQRVSREFNNSISTAPEANESEEDMMNELKAKKELLGIQRALYNQKLNLAKIMTENRAKVVKRETEHLSQTIEDSRAQQMVHLERKLNVEQERLKKELKQKEMEIEIISLDDSLENMLWQQRECEDEDGAMDTEDTEDTENAEDDNAQE